MTNTPNPMFAKFDQALGVTTPTPTDGSKPVTSRADEIRNLGKSPSSTGDSFLGGNLTPLGQGIVNVGKSIWGGVKGVTDAVTNAGVNTVNKIGSDLQSNQGLAQKAVDNGTNPVVAAGLSAAKGVTNIAGDVVGGAGEAIVKSISSLLPQGYKTDLKTGMAQGMSDIKAAWDAPAKTPEEQAGKDKVHAFVDSLVNIVKNNPETAKTVGDAIQMVLAPSALEGGISTLKKGADLVGTAIDTAKPIVKGAVQGVKDTASTIAENVSSDVSALKNKLPFTSKTGATGIERPAVNITPEAAQTSAWKDIQPKTTPTTKLAYAKMGNTTEQTAFSKGKITPSTADKKLMDSYGKLYEDGTVNDTMSPNQKQAAVSQKAAQLHGQQKDFLATHDKAVNLTSTDVKGKTTGLFDTLDATAKKSSMPFAKDASAKGAYDSAIDTFKSQLETGGSAGTVKGATTLSKIDQALTNFDAEMEKFGAWGKTKTGEMTDTAMARQQAIRDVHTQVRNFISNNLPKNSPWSAIRLEESNMYQISDRLAQRTADTVGISGAGQMIKDNPIIKTGVKAVGLGAGLHIVP
jgi:hypothetical protein